MSELCLYGIPNCDTVKRARAWLAEREIPYRFHDFKREGLSTELAKAWISACGADTVLNRRGTAWKGLSEAEQARANDTDGLVTLLVERPSLVKRPVLNIEGGITIGFNADLYATLFPAHS